MKQGLPLATGMEIIYVVKDIKKWEVDPARAASEFDCWLLSGAAGEGFGGNGVCFTTQEFLILTLGAREH